MTLSNHIEHVRPVENPEAERPIEDLEVIFEKGVNFPSELADGYLDYIKDTYQEP